MQRLVALVPVLALLLAAAPAQAVDVNAARFETSPPSSSAPAGVSPEVFYDAPTGTYYLLTTSQPSAEYRSTDGLSWTPVGNTLPRGIDWSIVQEGPSSYRLYYAEMAPGAVGPPVPCAPKSKQLRYATSSDLVNWTPQPPVLLDDVGCGVPHVMKTSAGRYFLYFNKMADNVHGVRVATSSDGLSWTERPGIVAKDQALVDPAPIQMPDGSFVMIGSTVGKGGSAQELQILTSTDAITWTLNPKKLYSVAGVSVLDPSVELIDGKLRVWFGYAPGMNHANSRIAVGTILFDAPTGNKATTTTSTTKPKPKLGAKCTRRGAQTSTLVCATGKNGLVWKKR